eukprot:c27953_g2_i1 orf=539-2308(+)
MKLGVGQEQLFGPSVEIERFGSNVESTLPDVSSEVRHETSEKPKQIEDRSICTDALGIPGHNACLDCLRGVQVQNPLTLPMCPLCRTPCNLDRSLYLKASLRGTLDHALPLESRVKHAEVEHGRISEVVSQRALSKQDRHRKFFFYDLPLPEETGAWIPVSVPPIGDTSNLACVEGNDSDGGFFPEECAWINEREGAPELTMWSILMEIVSIACGSWNERCIFGKLQASKRVMLEEGTSEGWMDIFDPYASFLTDEMDLHIRTMQSVLTAEPPLWMPDSVTFVCMQCSSRFHPITRPRHHCRFCGGIFCGTCSTGRSLLPVKFRERIPKRVCDSCWGKLESVQGILLEQVSCAAQLATHDVMDLSSVRSWVNNPVGMSMEYEIYKATNTLRSYLEIGKLRPERSIPDVVLAGAKGLAIITVLKAGLMLTYKVGTGLVVARRQDGSWSAPSAIATCGISWGAQAGGEITDFIMVLRTAEAVKLFAGSAHFSLGFGISVAAGPVGRTVEADICVGAGGEAACYMYSRSKGLFIGCSLEGNAVISRTATNREFYGDPYISTSDILLGPMQRPKAATPLYIALTDLFNRISQD